MRSSATRPQRATLTKPPTRTCIGCREIVELDPSGRSSALRLTTANGRVEVRRGDQIPAAGRGAWVHHNEACIAQLGRKGALARALRSAIDGAALLDAIEQAGATVRFRPECVRD